MQQLYKLKVRGTPVAVDTYDNCLIWLAAGWGWVPTQHSHLLRVELEPVVVRKQK